MTVVRWQHKLIKVTLDSERPHDDCQVAAFEERGKMGVGPPFGPHHMWRGYTPFNKFINRKGPYFVPSR